MKRFIKYYKPYKLLFTVDLIAAIIIAVCNLFYPSVVKNIINKYIFEDTPKNLIIFSAVLLAIYLLKAVCTYIVSYYGHIMGIKMQKDMRSDLFAKYQTLPTKFFDDNKTGDLLSRLVNDLFEVSELAHHGPENLFLASLMFIGSFSVLITIDVYLTLIVLAAVPFIIIFTCLSRVEMRSSMRSYRKKTAEINSLLENSISGIRETKTYVKEHCEKEKFNNVNSTYATVRGKTMNSLAKYETVIAFIQDFLYLLIIFAGGLFLFYGRINAGEFAAFILYIGMFLNPIQKIAVLFEQFQEGMAGFSRFSEIMATSEEVDTGTIIPEKIYGDINFANVTFSYSENGEDEVLKDLNLHIRSGETLALVGPSGGGKTTICNLIPRLYTLNSGNIYLDGVDINDIKLSALRKSIGVVSQNVFLFDGTIRENIAYGLPEDATDEQIENAAKRANIHDYVITLKDGYDTQVGERGLKLSGGQRQRIAIARVFLKNPPILILDEATSALDNITEMQIQQSLEKLSFGRTVIVVAHRLSTVKNASRIAVIDKNGISEIGTHKELLEKGEKYAKLYKTSLRSN